MSEANGGVKLRERALPKSIALLWGAVMLAAAAIATGFIVHCLVRLFEFGWGVIA